MATEKEMGVMQPQAQKCQQSPEAEGCKESTLPLSSGRARGPADTLMLTQ